MKFYLGVHLPDWLCRPHDYWVGRAAFEGVRLFVSANRLRDRKTWRPARVEYAIDSGGFSMIAKYGYWPIGPAEYVEDLRRWFDQMGPAEWVAPQDWMCEPQMLKKTGKTVEEHQRLTTRNFVALRSMAPDLPFIPVLQGWVLGDYLNHVEQYRKSGFDLAKEELVGVGSVCRRQATGDAEEIMRTLAGFKIKTHGFGFKIDGLKRCAGVMHSADSMAWSFGARNSPPLPKCRHKNCANCPLYARKWYEEKILPIIEGVSR